MKAVILYQPNSDYARRVEEFVHDFQRIHPGVQIETKSLDTEEGAKVAELYDVIAPPAVLALRGDGTMLQMWQGQDLPLMNEVAAYA